MGMVSPTQSTNIFSPARCSWRSTTSCWRPHRSYSSQKGLYPLRLNVSRILALAAGLTAAVAFAAKPSKTPVFVDREYRFADVDTIFVLPAVDLRVAKIRTPKSNCWRSTSRRYSTLGGWDTKLNRSRRKARNPPRVPV